MNRVMNLGWPNRITIGRLLLVGPFALCLLNLNEPGREWLRLLAVGVFAMMAVSDMLDGFLARRFHNESPLGKFLDPLADKLLITVALIILAVVGVPSVDGSAGPRHRLPDWVVVSAVGKDLIVCLGFAVIYFATQSVFIQPRWCGKACTTVQLALVLWTLLLTDRPGAAMIMTRALHVGAAGLAVIATLDYVVLGFRHMAAPAVVRGPADSGIAHHAEGRDDV